MSNNHKSIKMKSKKNDEKSKQEPDLIDLWEKCPKTCGCEKGCAIDDAIFYESALLDDYRARLKNDRSKK
jgi:hypothetical protein